MENQVATESIALTVRTISELRAMKHVSCLGKHFATCIYLLCDVYLQEDKQ